MDIIQFVIDNANTLFAILGGFVSIASLIVALTPSHTDDEVVGRIRGILERLSLIRHTEGRQ